MKKIITLVFSVGLLTTAFAQQGDRRQNDPRSNNYTTQSNHNSGNYGNNDRSGQYDNRGNQNQYRSNQDQFRGNQNQYRGNQDRNQYDNESFGRDRDDQMRRMPPVRYNDSYQYNRRVPLLQLMFGFGRHR